MFKKLALFALLLGLSVPFTTYGAHNWRNNMVFAPALPAGMLAGVLLTSVALKKGATTLIHKGIISEKTAQYLTHYSKLRFVVATLFSLSIFFHSHEGKLSCWQCGDAFSNFYLGVIVGTFAPELTLVGTIKSKLKALYA